MSDQAVGIETLLSQMGGRMVEEARREQRQIEAMARGGAAVAPRPTASRSVDLGRSELDERIAALGGSLGVVDAGSGGDGIPDLAQLREEVQREISEHPGPKPRSAIREAVMDPVRTGVPEEDAMTVPGLSGQQSVGTELTTSGMPEHEPYDQEYDPESGPGTEGQHAEGDDGELVGAADPSKIDAMNELEGLIARLDNQNLSHGDEDGHPIQPDVPGNEDEIMPGGDVYPGAEVDMTVRVGESGDIGDLVDRLIERQLDEIRSRARTRRMRQKDGGTLNVGQTGNEFWDEDDGPDSTNPPLDAEAPEHYLDAADQTNYPTMFPELSPGPAGPIPNEAAGKAAISVGEAVRVRRAIDLVVEGKSPKLVAEKLIES